MPLEEVPGELCENQIRDIFFVFEKDNLEIESKKKVPIFLGNHLGISYATC